MFDVPKLQAWTITDARITTAAASLSLNQLKYRLFTADSSVENFGSINVERSVELSSGSGQRLSSWLGQSLRIAGCRVMVIKLRFRHSHAVLSFSGSLLPMKSQLFHFRNCPQHPPSDTAG